MKDRMRILTSLIAVLALTGASAQTATPVPRLVVTIMVDQLRSDYLEAFAPLYGEGGFNRLLKEGRVYTTARYPMAQLDDASSVATFFTGTVPYNHGIIAEQWLDRSTLRPVYCVDDAEYRGWVTNDASSAKNLGVTTITDELKIATSSRALVYAFAPSRDMAVLSAGHAADGAFWISDLTGCWCGTSYYGNMPDWLTRNSSSTDLGQRLKKFVYQPLSESVTNYNYYLTSGQNTPFKHKFIYSDQFSSFKSSVLVNDEVNRMVQACLDQSQVGQDDITDFLSVSYYGGNFEHRSIQERPLEMQDAYVRMDQSISQLLSMLESKVGLDKTLVVLTSTGCEDKNEPDISSFRIPQGTFYMNRTQALLNMYFMATYGEGRYVDAAFDNQIYLNHKQFTDKQVSMSEALDKAQEFLQQCEGVKTVYTTRTLMLEAGAPDVNLLRNSFNPKTSGDIIVELIPGWKLQNEELQTSYRDRSVVADFPLIFMGYEVAHDQIHVPTSMDVVASTLARVLRIRAPNACTSSPIKGLR